MLDNHTTPVVILCGGKGTRLREETELKPKPMVEIGEKPILWHIMKTYASYGFKNFILALGYKGNYIKNYFLQNRMIAGDITLSMNPKNDPVFHSYHDDIDWNISLIETGENTLKGARIKKLEQYIEGDYFHLTYGDGLGKVNIAELDEYHRKHDSIGTVTAVHPPSRFGEMIIENDFAVHFEEKPQLHTGYINGGFFVFDKKFLNYLTTNENCDLEFGALQKLSEEKQLRVYKHDGFWQCMDNVRERDYLNKLWADNKAPWKIW